MAAAGTSPALNLREKLAELAGLKQRVSPDLVRCDFTNLVTNGGFDTDTGWTKGTGWTIGSGTALANPSSANLAQGGKLQSGRLYYTSYEVSSYSAGTVFITSSNGNGTSRSANGTYTETILGGTAGDIIFTAAGFTARIDNVAIYEADPSDDAPWLRLPYGYKVGKRGMIVRDGVVLHPSDYTEITDSGQTFIKPIVAPGVSTEFSIWAGA